MDASGPVGGSIRLTLAPKAAPVSLDTVEEAIQAVREHGLRLSTPRRLVLEALFAAHDPVSALQLAQQLQVDTTSVYRNLELLERHGLVRHVHLGHGAGLYVLAGRREFEYLYCERCENVTPVATHDLDPVRSHLEREFGFRAGFTHFAIVGVCKRCARRRRQ